MSARSHPVSHIIWDWNGTLFDDADLCRDIINGMLHSRGKPTLDAQRYEEAFGFPVRDYYARIGFNFNEEPFDLAAIEFMNAYMRRWAESSLRAGAFEILGSLSDAGYRQSILSAMQQELLEEMTTFFGVRDRFHRLAGLDNHYADGKLDNGRQLVAQTGCSPDDLLLVGDTVHDHEVAKAIGVRCLLIPCGHQSRAKLVQCGAPVADSLDEIARLLL